MDPVMVATGHTYDRLYIERWLGQGNRTCPITGMRLRHLELTPNFAMRKAIQVCSHSQPEGCAGDVEVGRWRSFVVCSRMALGTGRVNA